MKKCRLIFLVFMLSLAIGFSAAVGIGFGYMPARKASKLNPIDALRSYRGVVKIYDFFVSSCLLIYLFFPRVFLSYLGIINLEL